MSSSRTTAAANAKPAVTEPRTPESHRAADGLFALGNQAIQRLYRGDRVQTKLAVGSADDPLEAEADRIAEHAIGTNPPCDCGATCSKCGGREPQIQRKSISAAPSGAVANLALGAGQAMDSSTRERFESRLGHDFGNVRIHTDARADRSAESLRALAYTTGTDIAFRTGRYSPETRDGERLLAHELAHVVQQSHNPAASRIQRQEDEQQQGPNAELVVPDGYSIPFDSRAIVNDQPYLEALLKKLIIEEKKESAARQFFYGFGNAYPLPPGGVPEESSELASAREMLSTMEAALIVVETEALTFKTDLTTSAKAVLDALLDESERRMNEEKEKYGLEEKYYSMDALMQNAGGAPGAVESPPAIHGSHTEYLMNDDVRTQGLAGAARELAAKRKEILDLKIKRNDAKVPRPVEARTSQDAEQFGMEAMEVYGYDRDIKEKEAELQILRQYYETKYPILGSFAEYEGHAGLENDEKLAQVGSGPGTETAVLLLGEIDRRLRNIDDVRKGFPEKGDVWKLPTIIAATMRAEGFEPGGFEAALASDYMSDAQDSFAGDVLMAISIALTAVLAVPSGGASVGIGVTVARGAVILLDAAQIYLDVEKYELEKAAANTDFDRARAVSAQDPSLFWLGLSIVLTAYFSLDDLKSMFKGIAIPVRRALAGSTDDLAKHTKEIGTAVRAHGGSPALERAVIDQVTKAAQRKSGVSAMEAAGGAVGDHARAIEKAASDSVDVSKTMSSDSLKAVHIEAELEHLARSGALSGTPGFRKGMIGDHQWIENGPGRWCRYSQSPLCVLLDPDAHSEMLDVTGRLGKETVGTAEHKAARWNEYQASGGIDDYDTWSQTYDDTIKFGATGECPVGPIDESLLQKVARGAPAPGTHLPEVRYLGSDLPAAVDVPDAGAGSWYAMGPLDDQGRATWIDAVLNETDLSHARRGRLPDPPGWESGLGYNRTHLGAHELGFPPDPRNVTTAAREVNTFGNLPPEGMADLRPPNMREVETQVADTLRRGHTVRYRVVPIYHGNAPMPVAYAMQARGSDGLSIDTVVRGWTHHPNAPAGAQTGVVQPKCISCEDESRRIGVQARCSSCVENAEAEASLDRARSTLVGASQALPHFDRIQASFGQHDLSDVRTMTGGSARAANDGIGARAYTAGTQIGFRDAPDEWLAAHESAHVIQQRDGAVAPGNSNNDSWERHADEVADAVVSGRSAEPLLDTIAHGSGTRTPPLQLDAPDAGVPDADYGDVSPDAAIVDAGVPEIAGTPPPEGTVNLGGVILLHPDPELLRQELMQYTIEHGASGLQEAKDMLDAQAELASNNPDYYDGNANYGYNSADLVVQVHRNAAPIFEYLFALIAEIRDTFKKHAYLNAELILDSNEKQARGEALRYGITGSKHPKGASAATVLALAVGLLPAYTMHDSEEEGGGYYEATKLAAAAKILLERREAIDLKRAELFTLSEDQWETWQGEMQIMKDEYDRVRDGLIHRFPILAGFSRLDEDEQAALRTIASGPNNQTANILGAEISTKLENIMEVRANLYDPSQVDIWRLENLVGVTMAQLGWEEDPLKKMIIEETVMLANRPGLLEDLALALFNIAALVLAVPTYGLSLVVAAGVNAYVAYQHVQEYLMQKALSGTAFDKAQALTAQEPDLFWLAVEIIFVAVDVVGAAKILKSLGPLVKAARTASQGKKALEAIEAARIAARKEGGEVFAQRVEDGIRAARQGRDVELELAGATTKELDALAAAARAADSSFVDDVGEAIVTPTGGRVRVSKNGTVWTCSSPCEQLVAKYSEALAADPDMLAKLKRVESNAKNAADELDQAKASRDVKRIKQAEDALERAKQEAADFEGSLLVKHPELQGIEGTAETVEALKQVEAEAQITKGRLDPRKMDAPPPPKPKKLAPEEEDLWEQYESYYSGRYEALQSKLPPGAKPVDPPLSWNAYSDFLGKFRRGTSYQRGVQEGLEAEAELRRMGIPSDDVLKGSEDPIFGSMQRPVVEPRGNVGVAGKEITDPTVKYADQLIYDEATLGTAQQQVVTVSNKSRVFPEGKLKPLSKASIKDQVIADATEAVEKYGGTINVRRADNPLFNRSVDVTKVVLVYDARFVSQEVEAVIREALENFSHDGQSVTVVFR